MRIMVCDTEVFKYNWLFVGRYLDEDSHVIIHNDNDHLIDLINDPDIIFCGFNMKGYDLFIIKAIVMNAIPEEVKAVNDWIIGGNRGWDCPYFLNGSPNFNYMDIMDDMQSGTSLKSIEGHLGMNIEESSVSFDIDRPLTQDELEKSIHYCIHDVDATVEVVKIREEYLKTKLALGREKGWSDAESLSLTNAKLTAKYLEANLPSKKRSDERSYTYPDNLILSKIPDEVITYFDRMKDPSISDDDLWGASLNITLNTCPITMGFGGIHGAVPRYIEEATEKRKILNVDVSSYYPSLMINNNYCSRNIPSPDVFKSVLERRLEAKRIGDKAVANALKLIVNTTYGATLDKYNNLYDPLMGRSVCVSGQLYLLELAATLSDIQTLKLIQLNTDGIMVSVDTEHLSKVRECCEEWQKRTGFILEEDHIAKIIQKDVNNYIEVGTEGQLKLKGGYFKTGINTVGAFSINNNMTIVCKAIIDHFIKGIPAKETIRNCDDMMQFQLIAKASHKYAGCFQYVNNERVELQMCNRVYPTKDKTYGIVYKYKDGNTFARVQNLPDHCRIDNDNHLTIQDIDKNFYIKIAEKRISDFYKTEETGGLFEEMPSKKTTEPIIEKEVVPTVIDYSSKNIYQKLLIARSMFLKKGVKKTGKNPGLRFLYFELDDIIPPITEIFNTVGLIALVTFERHEVGKMGKLRLVNTDNPSEEIYFWSPMEDIKPIISGKTGEEVNNAMQRLGSIETYTRRYLYYVTMDICEQDTIDNDKEIPNEPPKPAAPATSEQRTEIKEQLTNVDGEADEMQKAALRNHCENLYKLAEPNEPYQDIIQQIADETDNFTKVSKARCEEFLMAIINAEQQLEESGRTPF